MTIARSSRLFPLCIAVATGALALGAGPAEALTIDPILTLNGNQTQFTGDGPWTLGFSFTTDLSQTFNALGVADFGALGLSETHDIGLYDDAGNLLASVLGVTGTADAVQDGFVWAAITPITLNAGTYIVGASGQWSNDPYSFNGTINTDTGFTYNSSRYVSGLSLAYPGTPGLEPGYFGANISKTTTTAPVPGPLPVFGVAAALSYSRKLRQRLRGSKALVAGTTL